MKVKGIVTLEELHPGGRRLVTRGYNHITQQGLSYLMRQIWEIAGTYPGESNNVFQTICISDSTTPFDPEETVVPGTTLVFYTPSVKEFVEKGNNWRKYRISLVVSRTAALFTWGSIALCFQGAADYEGARLLLGQPYAKGEKYVRVTYELVLSGG